MTTATIEAYEAMAKLNLNGETRQWAVEVLTRLEESFKKLQTVDTVGIEPLVTVLDMKNVLRDDVSRKFVTRDELLSNAPEEYDGYFQVPKTLE